MGVASSKSKSKNKILLQAHLASCANGKQHASNRGKGDSQKRLQSQREADWPELDYNGACLALGYEHAKAQASPTIIDCDGVAPQAVDGFTSSQIIASTRGSKFYLNEHHDDSVCAPLQTTSYERKPHHHHHPPPHSRRRLQAAYKRKQDITPPQSQVVVSADQEANGLFDKHVEDLYQASVALSHQRFPIYEDADDFYTTHEQHYNHNHNHNHNHNNNGASHLISSSQALASARPDCYIPAANYWHPSNYQQQKQVSTHSASVHNLYQRANNYSPTTTSTNSCYQAAAATTSKRSQQKRRIRKVLKDPHTRAEAFERGLAMSEDERKRVGMAGLVPPAYQDQELQSRAVLNFIDHCQDELAKYMYLRNLKDFNEHLFYYTLINNVQKLMPLVYTPTVGLACQKFSEIYMRPRGLFVSAKDAGRVRQLVGNWPGKDVRVIVITDGERILGLGDLGANGMGISIGKLSLYTALAGIPPENVLPVTLDVGTQNESNLKDPFYIGLRQQRLRGEKYEALVDEFMHAVVERWGRSCLIQFEDFANSTAFNLLERYRNDYCTFNDDIQGTASVCLAGLITAARVTGKRLADCTFLFQGAGEANLGTANLLLMAMCEDGLEREEAKRRVWLVDSKGLVVRGRTDLNKHKQEFAQQAEQLTNLEAVVDFVKPSAIVGASAQGGSFTESICRKMAHYNQRPIIFALSNPTSKAECTAQQAYEWTQAKCVFASGSPFEPVQMNGQTYVTGQGNNVYIFPGVGLASIGAHTHTVPEQVFLVAARALSDQVSQQDIDSGLVYPSLARVREVTLRVATRVLEYYYAERLANYQPEPNNKEDFLRSLQYDPRY